MLGYFVSLVAVNKKEEDVVVVHLSIGSYKAILGWSHYRDVNPVPTNALCDDSASEPSGPVVLWWSDSVNTYHMHS